MKNNQVKSAIHAILNDVPVRKALDEARQHYLSYDDWKTSPPEDEEDPDAYSFKERQTIKISSSIDFDKDAGEFPNGALDAIVAEMKRVLPDTPEMDALSVKDIELDDDEDSQYYSFPTLTFVDDFECYHEWEETEYLDGDPDSNANSYEKAMEQVTKKANEFPGVKFYFDIDWETDIVEEAAEKCVSARCMLKEAAEKYLDADSITSNGAVKNFFVDPSLVRSFKGFMDAWQKSNDEYYKVKLPNVVNEPLQYTVGRSYIKVVRRGSVECFIDRYGNVYKPASWNAPAKGVRYYIDDWRSIPFDPYTSFLYNRNIPARTADFYANGDGTVNEAVDSIKSFDAEAIANGFVKKYSKLLDKFYGQYLGIPKSDYAAYIEVEPGNTDSYYIVRFTYADASDINRILVKNGYINSFFSDEGRDLLDRLFNAYGLSLGEDKYYNVDIHKKNA